MDISVIELLDNIVSEFPILYYITCLIIFIVTMLYLLKKKSILNFRDMALNDVVTSVITFIIITLIAFREPLIFLLALIIVILFQINKILKFISDNSHIELNKYKDYYNNIIDKDDYTFLEILILYNLISLEDYQFLFTKHADKTEDEMIQILQERVILDNDKKQTAMILFNQYKLNKQLLNRESEVFEEIKNNLNRDGE